MPDLLDFWGFQVFLILFSSQLQLCLKKLWFGWTFFAFFKKLKLIFYSKNSYFFAFFKVLLRKKFSLFLLSVHFCNLFSLLSTFWSFVSNFPKNLTKQAGGTFCPFAKQWQILRRFFYTQSGEGVKIFWAIVDGPQMEIVFKLFYQHFSSKESNWLSRKCKASAGWWWLKWIQFVWHPTVIHQHTYIQWDLHNFWVFSNRAAY